MNRPHTLSQPSWRSHWRVLGAIAKKDWLHFVRYPLDAVFNIIQPLMWLTPIYFLGQSFQQAGSNRGFAGYTGSGDYMSFILIGSLLSSYVSSVFWRMGYALKNEMDQGVLESNWLTPVPRILLLGGRTISSLVTTTISNVGILALGWLLFGFSIQDDLLPALGILLPVLVAIYGFGLGFAAIVLVMRDANTLIDVSDYLVSIFSGSQFPVQALPALLFPIAFFLPLTYGYDAVRGLLLNTVTLLPLWQEILILLIFMAVMLPFGYAVFKRVERRCAQLGTIGLH